MHWLFKKIGFLLIISLLFCNLRHKAECFHWAQKNLWVTKTLYGNFFRFRCFYNSGCWLLSTNISTKYNQKTCLYQIINKFYPKGNWSYLRACRYKLLHNNKIWRKKQYNYRHGLRSSRAIPALKIKRMTHINNVGIYTD